MLKTYKLTFKIRQLAVLFFFQDLRNLQSSACVSCFAVCFRTGVAARGAGRAGHRWDVHSFPHCVPLLCRAVPDCSAQRWRRVFVHVCPVRLYGGSIRHFSGEFQTLPYHPRSSEFLLSADFRLSQRSSVISVNCC